MRNENLIVRCPGMENGKFHIDHTGRGRDLSPDLILENNGAETPAEQAEKIWRL